MDNLESRYPGLGFTDHVYFLSKYTYSDYIHIRI
ncbi:hypothetical protein Nwat_3155 (plasmid) [Nitrosococcus watsonii C-113]|uniref:Uncharacterized protein n=1 Tax=Nitrosococcus watsoni (strain C-113) TaxID=105559 RepID=D8KCD1_NITWC|nr:hypothetical protein Nwat_3155 [Nitrosococcus watsonii C-113]